MSSLNMATGLERISGMPKLEERCGDSIYTGSEMIFIAVLLSFLRLRCTIQRCIKIWQTSLATAYSGYLSKVKESLLHYQQQQQMESQSKTLL